MADVSQQPRRIPGIDRLLRGADGHVRGAVRVRRPSPRATSDCTLRRHGAPDRGVGRPAVPGSVPVGHGSAVSDQGSGWRVRIRCLLDGDGDGYRRGRDRAAFVVAKPVCRTGDRLDPAGMSGPRDRAE